jgi:hypothetical protein
MAFHATFMNFVMLKFFWVKFLPLPENCSFPKTLRFRKNFVLHSRLMANYAQKYGLSTVAIF